MGETTLRQAEGILSRSRSKDGLSSLSLSLSVTVSFVYSPFHGQEKKEVSKKSRLMVLGMQAGGLVVLAPLTLIVNPILVSQSPLIPGARTSNRKQ